MFRLGGQATLSIVTYNNIPALVLLVHFAKDYDDAAH